MLLCPKCTDSLHITDRQGIEIDFCPICRGVWLDAGELEKIIERAIQTESQFNKRSGSAYESDYDDRAYQNRDRMHRPGTYTKHKKKKHFLEELFDLFD